MTSKFACRLGTYCALAFLISIFSPNGVSAAPPSPTPGELASEANKRFGLARSQVVRLAVDRGPGGTSRVQVNVGGFGDTLLLTPYSVRAAGAQLLVQGADGAVVEVPSGPIRTLRGELEEVPGSIIAASLLEDGLHARIMLPSGEEYWLEPIGLRIAGAHAADHLLYHGDDVLETHGVCGAEELLDAQAAAAPAASAEGATAEAGAIKLAQLACDADFEYFTRYGSETAVQGRIENVINSVNVQYERDVGITHEITALIVRTAEQDPYSSTDALTLLNQFRDHWNANHGNIERDVAQLFTDKQIDGSTIGIAWLNAICTSFGYGMVQSDFNGNFSCATDLSAHELGHNWGAGHCSCTSHTMNPYITCANQFHPTSTIPVILDFRDSRTCLDDIVSTPPAAPSGLEAAAVSHADIDLVWIDNATDENGFDVERSLNGVDFSAVTTLPADTTSYTDVGLDEQTLYTYRVRAFNSAGDSDYSNMASATTDEAPAYVDQVAQAELPAAGAVSGNYTATWDNGGAVQHITERESGGKPSRRTSQLEHAWEFDVLPGAAISAFVDAWGGSSEDGFVFAYSTDGGLTFNTMMEVPQADDGVAQAFPLPATTSGTVWIRVTDTDRTPGNRSLETVTVDHLFIRSDLSPGSPPAAPTVLSAQADAATQVSLSWNENATDEYGYEIERSSDGTTWNAIATVGENVSTYIDTSATPNAELTYRVRAYNGAGYSAFSNQAMVTTPDGLALESAVGRKVKGVHHVDLTWSGNTEDGQVVIQRNGAVVATVPNNGSYTDNTGNKGGAVYIYEVCETGPGNCSNALEVNF